ncbi:MAG: hypothetical protein RL277_317 [Planctomycetota bacterium]|jgi:hypothetical protein
MMARRNWIYALIGALVLALSLVPVPAGLQGRSICTFRNLFDLPCPGCGVTRSLRATAHGDLASALDLNPFGPLFFGAAVLLLLSPLWQRLHPDWDLKLISSRWARVGAVALLVSMLLYGLLRILHTAGQDG